ncbi:MAG: hypothetical protein JW983_08205 [Elusimicrobia bacterium]|nr:hypothetical protein [Elusimicrobiota bacterium]
MEYTRKMDWQLNNAVKTELVKRWVDTQKLRITTSKGYVEIKGELVFTGKLATDMDRAAIISFLKTLDMMLKGLPNLRGVKWKLDAWQKVGVRWEPTAGHKKAEE